ncbi:MAG: glycine--tRNA ligase subunit beta [Elusimicrobia bacterium]|nr:glycine--tRNA ligase subunit beta [Elusimicrobiota bacterium]
MASKDLLLEIGTEPLPARFVAPALAQLKARMEDGLKSSRLGFKSSAVYGTLRRLAIFVEGVADKSERLVEEVQGPPARLLKDAHGGFTVQAAGFAQKWGLDPGQLRIVKTEKGEYLSASHEIPGQPAVRVLSTLLPNVISALEFPKSMEWEQGRFRFGRPIRGLLALWGSRVVPFSLAGIKAGRAVALPGGRKHALLKDPAKYLGLLKNSLVIVDVEQRGKTLAERLEACARQAKLSIDLDPSLIEETVYMTEHPSPVVGAFRPEFLDLPQPLLSLVLKRQLKFFPLLQAGKIARSFVGVRDGASRGQDLVREGYERVLEARLSDASFFLKRDLASRLEDKLPMLAGVAYQRDLGTMSDKARRVEELSAWLCEHLRSERPANEAAAARIARLCYADLVCEVVKEFPELQGTMGGYYARQDGEDERIALGIEQFYFPVGAKGPVPATDEGALASLAAKLDGLAGNFALGLVPTGSADPFGLRRQAFGVVRIVIEKQMPLDLEAALEKALALQPVSLDESKRKEILRQLKEFLWSRTQSFFEELGHRVDEIRAVRAQGLSNLPRTVRRLAALRSVRGHPDFDELAMAFKRASNILRQARFPIDDGVELERARLKEEAELSFFDALTAIEGQVREKFFHEHFEPGLKALVAIKGPLDSFFDKVMVMAEEADLRQQRLGLLARLVRLFRQVADLSELA